jgi:hypothetical protein
LRERIQAFRLKAVGFDLVAVNTRGKITSLFRGNPAWCSMYMFDAAFPQAFGHKKTVGHTD